MAPFTSASPRLPRSIDRRASVHSPPVRSSRLRSIIVIPLLAAAFILFPYLTGPPGPPPGHPDHADAHAHDRPDAYTDTHLAPPGSADGSDPFEPSFRSAKHHINKALSHFIKALEHHLGGVGARVGVMPGGKVAGSEVFVQDRGCVHYPPPGAVEGGAGGVRHPISWLIEEAERKWDGMLKRQSRTLEESVKEYRRRYGRAPPRGYELWWQYAVEHDVILKDEYDQVTTDLEPFLSLPAATVLSRAQQVINHTAYMSEEHMFAAEVKNGEAALLPGIYVETSRAYDVLDGLNRIARWLPDMVIPFTIEDGPGVAVSEEEKAAHVKAAREGRKLTPHDLEVMKDSTDPSFPLWETTCAPSSPLRRAWRGQGAGTDPHGPSLIGLDHAPAMDPCLRPDVRWKHSQTIVEGLARSERFPLVSFSKTPLHSDILSTPMEQFYNDVGTDPKWEDKKYNKVVWRGSTTGSWHGRNLLWRAGQRPRLVELANDAEGEREVYWADKSEGDIMHTRIVKEADVNKHWFDMAYVGLPLQCNYFPGIDETCVYMKDQFRFEQHMSTDDANAYKSVLDVDGNAWSGRFHKLMSSNAAVLKSTIYPEWWTQRAVPWYHYIPVKVDYSDLHHVASYFIGGPDGRGAHDEAGKKIGLQGQDWAQKHWRLEDMASYQLRLFLELARAFYGENGSHDYQG